MEKGVRTIFMFMLASTLSSACQTNSNQSPSDMSVQDSAPSVDLALPPAPPPLTAAGRAMGSAASSDGQLYAIGGANLQRIVATVQVYNSSTNAWTTAPSMSMARWLLTATTGTDGIIYAIGGTQSSSLPLQPLSIVETFSSSMNKWSMLSPLTTPRSAAAATTGVDGRIYVLGGEDANGPLKAAEVFTPSTQLWTSIADLPTARKLLAAATGPDGRIYAVGGFDINNVALDVVEIYDPASNQWQNAPSLLRATGNAGYCVLGGRLMVIGGVDSFGSAMNNAQAYTFSSNMWSALKSLPAPRYSMGAATAAGYAYIFGGLDSNQKLIATTDLYQPASDTWLSQ